MLIAHAVTPGLSIANQQGLFDKTIHHQLLELGTFRRFRVEPATELLERRAVGAWGNGLAVHLGDTQGWARLEVGIDAPENERNANQHQNDGGEDTF